MRQQGITKQAIVDAIAWPAGLESPWRTPMEASMWQCTGLSGVRMKLLRSVFIGGSVFWLTTLELFRGHGCGFKVIFNSSHSSSDEPV
jgi:hypothetical protein